MILACLASSPTTYDGSIPFLVWISFQFVLAVQYLLEHWCKSRPVPPLIALESKLVPFIVVRCLFIGIQRVKS